MTTKDWRLYALVGLTGFALVGVTQIASCGYKDVSFLHTQRLVYEKMVEQQQHLRQAPPPPVPPKPGGP